MDMLKVVTAQGQAGAMLQRPAGSNLPWTAPWRDLGHCHHILVSEALECTQAALHAEFEKAQQVSIAEADLAKAFLQADLAKAFLQTDLEVLDRIGRTFAAIYHECMQDNLAGLLKFGELYEYLEGNTRHMQVYSTFCMFAMQAQFAWMFTSRQMTIGLPAVPNQVVQEFSCVLNVLAALPDDIRNAAMDALLKKGVLPNTVNLAPLRKRTDEYVTAAEQLLRTQPIKKNAKKEGEERG